MNVEEDGEDGLGTTPMPASCTKWPCSARPAESKLESSHGFTRCRLCGASYGAVEVYDALCLKEPWLELILLGFKTLETRTKLMRKRSGPVVLCSSSEVDKGAWDAAWVGGRLDRVAKERAWGGLGKMRALVHMGGFRPGVPFVDDAAACIQIALPDGGVRFVSEISQVHRIVEVPTARVRPDGSLCAGASQGFFRVPKTSVEVIQ